MKKILLLITASLLAFAIPVQAQHYIGARAGWGLGYGRFTPISTYPMKWVWGTWSAGVQWKYYGKVRYIGAVGAELEYLQRAYQRQASLNSEDYTRRIYNTVNLPFIWHIHMNFNDNRLRVFLNAGVWASYNISAYESVKSGNVITEGPYHMQLVRDNPLGYGLLGGIGLNVVFGKWELMVEGRYYFSYGDILRNRAIYADNPVRSPLDNITLSLGFFYRIGDKPHTPLPPPWYARIIARNEAKRAQRELEKLGTPDAGSDGPDAGAGISGTQSMQIEGEAVEITDGGVTTDEEISVEGKSNEIITEEENETVEESNGIDETE